MLGLLREIRSQHGEGARDRCRATRTRRPPSPSGERHSRGIPTLQPSIDRGGHGGRRGGASAAPVGRARIGRLSLLRDEHLGRSPHGPGRVVGPARPIQERDEEYVVDDARYHGRANLQKTCRRARPGAPHYPTRLRRRVGTSDQGSADWKGVDPLGGYRTRLVLT